MSVLVRRRTRATVLLAVLGMTASLTAACGSDDSGGDGDRVTITLSGPNQWNNDPQSFGPAWEDLVERFEEAEPGIDVETTVLPVAEFAQTLSTQLSAGTAPELIFNQAPHTPDQVVALDDYLAQPNPYVEGNEAWIDLFNQDYFGPDAPTARNAAGNYEFIPFNLVIVGVYYNADIMDEAGVEAPIETWGELMDACAAITDAGYVPFSMDQGWLGQGWTMGIIGSMLLSSHAEEWNQFAADGQPGTAAQVTPKSMARAILTGELDPTATPEVAETMELLKQFFDECATPNWSGIAGGASFIGYDDFVGGRAAMTYGTNFAAENLADVDWEWGTMPFPTITEDESELSTGQEAQFGAAPGGTSYMIPATTEGEQLEAAVKFLQFVTSPEGGQPWLDGSGGIPSLVDAEPAPGLEGLMTGAWFETPTIPAVTFVPKARNGQTVYDGYLLGDKSLEDQLAEMRNDWTEWATEMAADGGWTEDWATQ
ncbi:ABC transporter substrate-binding protein [Jiangella rhizosphaerae]|uniref:Extracellular solute-binding protein n=1 Tax=Jiangella rhizosphaerae TaxID=2293569 RepID=A0A418KTW6_9ACTN|nr:extracellular solute-binding protein [Jiangella rhizosphaerae]RIQ30989.1 extracellular solute-binding protein [Jiangella rhizosphaerae]